MTGATKLDWFVVQTRPLAEARAAENLFRQGYEVYLPRYMKTVRHARRLSTVKTPLFPSYLFVRFEINRVQWRSINSTIGVKRLVGSDSAPTPMPLCVVEDLKRCEGEGFFKLLSLPAKFKSGAPIRIRGGALNSCHGIFEAQTDNERVTVLLDLLGRKSRVILDVHSIEAA